MNSELTDHELLRAYVTQGQEAAFRTLVERHANLVLGTATRQCPDRAAAEEIAQNVFLALARRAWLISPQPHLAGWLYRATILEARRHHRADYRRQRRESAAAVLGTLMKESDSPVAEWVPVLDEGLMRLREKDRHALLLRFFENRSLRQVGEALGVSEDTAQKRVATALERLTEFFRRRGFQVTAAAVAAWLNQPAGAAAGGWAAALAGRVLAASSAPHLGGLGLLLARFLWLPPSQVVLISALLATAPVAYHQYALAQARAEQRSLEADLVRTRDDAAARRDALAEDARRLGTQRAALARARGHPPRPLSPALPPDDESLYLWNEQADFVRLPKSITPDLTLSGQVRLPIADGQTMRRQEPSVYAGGGLSPVLGSALGLTPGESQTVATLLAGAMDQYQVLADTHSYLTNRPPAEFNVGDRESLTWVNGAFPEEGEALRVRVRADLTHALGEERAAVFWQQAQDTFARSLNDLGANETRQTVAVDASGKVSYWKGSRPAGADGWIMRESSYGGLNPARLPAPLRSFVSDRLPPANPNP